MESKVRESDSKRNTQLFEFEKEKTKLAMKNDHLASELSESKEAGKRNDRKIEILNRDIQKLKNEVRQNRKNMYGGGSQGSAAGGSSFLSSSNRYQSNTGLKAKAAQRTYISDGRDYRDLSDHGKETASSKSKSTFSEEQENLNPE